MSANVQKLILHPTVARHATFVMDTVIARQVGFDGLELSATKLDAFLAAGLTQDDLRSYLDGLDCPGLGYLPDIEHSDPQAAGLFADAEKLFNMAAMAGAKGVQILTGPLDVQQVLDYQNQPALHQDHAFLRLDHKDQIALCAANLQKLADLAAPYGLVLYLEALGWSPVNRLADQLEIIDRSARENVRIVIDYWHCYVSGDTPDMVAKIDKSLIYGVHFCDSNPYPGGIPIEPVLRDVPIGQGVINLKHWTNAVKATGYKGWWSAELFCLRQHQDNSFTVAQQLYNLMDSIIR
ncbi:sugar phosphate isomerase [Thalassospira sp. MIT1004]|nr:sugar phosphate isomerase [Thalassospira sp. MIT1004]